MQFLAYLNTIEVSGLTSGIIGSILSNPFTKPSRPNY